MKLLWNGILSWWYFEASIIRSFLNRVAQGSGNVNNRWEWFSKAAENDFLFHDHPQSLLGSGGLFSSPERNFKYLGQHTHTHTFMLWVAIHVQLEQQGLVQAQLLRLTSPPSASTSLSLKFVWFCPRQSQNPRNWEDLCWKIMIYVEQIPPSAGSRDYCSHSIPA